MEINMNDKTKSLYAALVALNEVPYGDIHFAMDRKTTLACLRLASRCAGEAGDRWRFRAEKIRDFYAGVGRKLIAKEDRYQYSRLIDSADHAESASASFREIDALILEMERLLPWRGNPKGNLQ